MIQRIQTVYLSITIILTFLIMKFPIMELLSLESDTFYKVNLIGVYDGQNLLYSLWPLLVLAILHILIALGSILLFKKRMLQIRLCVFNILLLIGFYAMSGGYYWILKEKFSMEIMLNWPIVLPAINIILTYLAIRAIGKDEALVKALDRLR